MTARLPRLLRFGALVAACLVLVTGLGVLASPTVREFLSPGAARTVSASPSGGAAAAATPSRLSSAAGAAAAGSAAGSPLASSPAAIASGSAAAPTPIPPGTATGQIIRVTTGTVRAAPAPACPAALPAATPTATSAALPTATPTANPVVRATWRDPGLVEHVPVLMYHRVVPLSRAGDSLRNLIVSPQLFAAQMAALHAAGWHAITFRQLAADLATGISEPPRTVVITFDDGYSDGYTYVLPVFRQYGFVGTFFVITDRIGIGAFFTGPELCALSRAGDEIANHTVHHVGLGTVPPATAQAEIVDAGRTIRQWTGVTPVTLAYPYGSWSPAVFPLLAQDGYGLAATTVYGAVEAYAGRYTVPRIRVGPGISPAGLLAALSPYAG